MELLKKKNQLEEKVQVKKIIDLTVHTKDGRVNVLNEDKEWVDVTDQWSGKEKEQ